MYTEEDHLKAGQKTLEGLRTIQLREIMLSKKCMFYQIKKKKYHIDRAEEMDKYIEKLGSKPTSFNAARVVPDNILAEMGWE